MKRLGLFGGSFDPVHNAHIEIAQASKEKYQLDEVHFIVAKQAPHKQNYLDAETRFELLEKAIAGKAGLKTSRIELERDGISYSYLTVEDYKRLYPEVQLFWIMGEDAFAGLAEWKNNQFLYDNLEFIVIPREIKISSSLVRERISHQEDLADLIPEPIQQLAAEYYCAK